MVPRTVLTRSGPISLNTARPVNTVQPRTAVNNAGPMKNVINNAYSTARRPFNKITAANNSNFTKKVNTVKGTRVNTARPKAVLSAVKGNKGNAVKASACWVWRPKHKILDHVSRNNGASMSFKRFDYIDAQGRSKAIHNNATIPPTQAQPITTITTHPESSQAALRIDKGKGIATESDEDPSKKLVSASTIVRPDPDEEKAVEEAKLLAISKPEVIKVVQEEAKKIGLDPKKIEVPKQVRSSKRLRMLNTKSSRESTLKKLKD
ncbi:hypothetical protein Tco_0583428 [Tanacetum coccineum]